MLRRWVPAGLLLSSVVITSPALLAQTAPTKSAAPTTAKPATTAPTAAKPATTTAKPTDPKAAKPTDAKAAKPTDPKATTTADAKASTTDAKAPATDAKAPATPPATDADKELARLLDDAKKSYKAGQFDKARELFATAYKQKPDRPTLLLLAQAEAKSNKPRDAAEHLEVYLREPKGPNLDDDRFNAEKLYADVTSKIATWIVKFSVDGADIYLDGKPIGKSPLVAPLFVEPNTHEIEARKEGFLPEKELLVAAPNTESESTVVLKPAPVEVKPKEVIEPPKERHVEPPPPPSPKWRTYGIIGGSALTVLGLGLGIGLKVSATNKGDEADSQLASLRQTTPTTYNVCGTNAFPSNTAGCMKVTDTLASQDSRANGAIFGFVLAGIGAVGTVGLIVLPKTPFGRKMMGRMSITPVITYNQLGGTLSGSF